MPLAHVRDFACFLLRRALIQDAGRLHQHINRARRRSTKLLQEFGVRREDLVQFAPEISGFLVRLDALVEVAFSSV